MSVPNLSLLTLLPAKKVDRIDNEWYDYNGNPRQWKKDKELLFCIHGTRANECKIGCGSEKFASRCTKHNESDKSRCIQCRLWYNPAIHSKAILLPEPAAREKYVLYVNESGALCYWNPDRGDKKRNGELRCIHNNRERQCNECKPLRCVHGASRKSYCIKCSPHLFCETHSKLKTLCKECVDAKIEGTGGSLCKCGSGVRKTYCRACKIQDIENNVPINERSGNSLCNLHQKSSCKHEECRQSNTSNTFCSDHGKVKYRSICRECFNNKTGGSKLCIHGTKSTCAACDGNSICKEHGTSRRSRCKQCKVLNIGGGELCKNHYLNVCLECKFNPKRGCISCKSVTVESKSPYKPYCYRCYYFHHPDEIPPKNIRVKEHYIFEYIAEMYGDILTSRNKPVVGGTSLKRPDFLFNFETYAIIIEVDENAHTKGQDYKCDEKRSMELLNDLKKPVVMIRINPDSCTMHPIPAFIMDSKNQVIVNEKEFNYRMETLCDMIDIYLLESPTREYTEKKLFFNNNEQSTSSSTHQMKVDDISKTKRSPKRAHVDAFDNNEEIESSKKISSSKYSLESIIESLKKSNRTDFPSKYDSKTRKVTYFCKFCNADRETHAQSFLIKTTEHCKVCLQSNLANNTIQMIDESKEKPIKSKGYSKYDFQLLLTSLKEILERDELRLLPESHGTKNLIVQCIHCNTSYENVNKHALTREGRKFTCKSEECKERKILEDCSKGMGELLTKHNINLIKGTTAQHNLSFECNVCRTTYHGKRKFDIKAKGFSCVQCASI
jgi:hypothetical protein